MVLAGVVGALNGIGFAVLLVTSSRRTARWKADFQRQERIKRGDELPDELP
jgi:hypothetical protein